MFDENETSYQGLIVTAEEKAELEGQAAGEFLRFTGNDDGSYTMQARLPEWGSVDGQDFRLRANLNRLACAITARCFDESGVFHAKTASNLLDEIEKKLDEADGCRKVTELLNIPAQFAEEFTRFLDLCQDSLLGNFLSEFDRQVGSLVDFQANLKLMSGTEDPRLRFTRSRLISESYPEYKNMLLMFNRLRNTDPETESRILFGMDCLGYGRLNEGMIPMVSAYRAAHGLSPLVAQAYKLDLSGKPRPLAPDSDEQYAFTEHYYTCVSAQIHGADKVISLEMTAPPAGKLLFCPMESRTGIGVYDNADAIQQYHAGRNLANVPNFPLYQECHNPPEAVTEGIDAIVPPENFELARGPVNQYFREKARLDALIPPAELERQHQLNTTRAEVAQGRIDRMRQRAERQTANSPEFRADPFRLDRERLTRKAMLGLYADHYRDFAGFDTELLEILDLMKQLSTLSATAIQGDYAAEQALSAQLFRKVEAYYTKMDEKQNPEIDRSFPDNTYDPERPEERAKYLIASNLMFYLEAQQMGTLDVIREPDAVFVDGTAFPITNTHSGTGEKDRFLPVTDGVLFPHDPSPNDIRQGALGNCYLLAALSTMAEQRPDALRRCLRDNGDGTVTVRFHQHKYNETTGESLGYVPVYVTVDKQVPESQGASKALWVQMIERAYAASGLHLINSDFARPVPSPEELEQEYQRLSALPPEKRPGYEECPWLISRTGELHRWQPDYNQIEAGSSNDFLECLLGNDVACDIAETDYIRNTMNLAVSDTSAYLIGRNYLAKAGDTATQAEKDAVSKSDGLTTEIATVMLFRTLFPELPVPRNQSGSYDSGAGPEASFVGRTVSLLGALSSMAVGSQDRNTLKTRQTELLSSFRTLLEDPSVPPADPMVASFQGVVSQMRPEFRQRLLAELPDICSYLDDALDLSVPPEPYSGVYTQEMNRVYRALEIAKGNSALMTASTPGSSDRVNRDGIYLNHAYSILDVHEKQLAGKTLKFVTLRNPHGRMGREYCEEGGEVKYHARRDVPGGVFDMEFADFCKEFDRINTAAPGVHRHKSPVIRAPMLGSCSLIGETLSSYSRAFGGSWKTLDVTDRDSAQFKAFFNQFKEFMEKGALDKYMGKDSHDLTAADPMIKLEQAADDYLRYCADHEKIGSRRKNRMAQAELVKQLVSALNKGCKNPKDLYAETLVEKLMDGHADYQALAPEAKQEQVSYVARSAVFGYLKDHLSFQQVYALSKKPAADVKKAFADMELRMAKEELAPQPAQADARQRQLQEPQLQNPQRGGPARHP